MQRLSILLEILHKWGQSDCRHGSWQSSLSPTKLALFFVFHSSFFYWRWFCWVICFTSRVAEMRFIGHNKRARSASADSSIDKLVKSPRWAGIDRAQAARGSQLRSWKIFQCLAKQLWTVTVMKSTNLRPVSGSSGIYTVPKWLSLQFDWPGTWRESDRCDRIVAIVKRLTWRTTSVGISSRIQGVWVGFLSKVRWWVSLWKVCREPAPMAHTWFSRYEKPAVHRAHTVTDMSYI